MASFAVQTNMIRGLTKKQYSMLKEMCRYSNNLYNVALYSIRQYFFANKKFLNYENNYHICKENENYALLQAGVSQQTLKVADRSFKSFFNLLKKCSTGDYRYHDVKIPHYRKKGGLFNLILSTNAISVRNGYFKIPMSRAFRALHPDDDDIRIPFPERLKDKNIREVRILPIQSSAAFKIQYVYEVQPEKLSLNRDNALAIDLGVDNLAACVPTTGTPFLMDGRKIKSINHRWNRELARLRSVSMKQGKRTTDRILRITERRNRRIGDIIKKSARYIIDYCCGNDIGTLIVGYNADFKRYSDMGRQNNQNFVQIPLGNLRQQLGYLCWKYGIEYIEQEESYTSQSSFLDKDPLPVYRPEQPYVGTFSGKRIKRGLYRSKNGTLLNADINGAANIMRKCKQDLDFEKLCTGVLAAPRRIRVA